MQLPLLHETVLNLDPSWANRPAIKTSKGMVTYAELNDAVSRLASWLVENGTCKGDRVGVCLPKSIDSVMCLLAVMSAGATYVPVDPTAPVNRVATIITDAGARHLFTYSKMAADLQEHHGDLDLPTINVIDEPGTGGGVVKFLGSTQVSPGLPQSGLDDLAAMLYTSGSTGNPKGVMLSHRNISTFVDWTVKRFNFTHNDRLTSHAPFHFDLSTMDLYTTFRVGASVFILDDVLVKFPSSISKILEKEQITSWYSVPTALRLLLDHGALDRRDLSSLRQIFYAGEAFPVPALRNVMQAFPNVDFVNLYGPTETNVCTYYRLPGVPGETTMDIPIGLPCEHYDITIRGDNDEILGPGKMGEICVAGPGVMRGYWNRPDLTGACRFDGRDDSYRTGDYGTWLPDGNIRFHGRKDNQVKVRGHRVELNEIENVISASPVVKESAVIFYQPENDEDQLLAYVIVEEGMSADESLVLEQCAQYLPHYAEPHKVVFLENFPRTSTGKVDRQSLLARSGEYI